jgi:CRISPR type I-E-associated protein CasA/Cse1
MRKEMVAKKKADTIMKEKEIKKKPEPQKINLDHDFSFNLLTEPWLPVVSMKGEKKFPSLNEFLKQAQDLERFDFPLPGLETAVLRFLVAIVHIVGAPNDKAEWEDWYKRGKFEDTFITELQKYKDKLDLFSKTDPFLQEIELKSSLVSELNNINRLIHFFPMTQTLLTGCINLMH